MEGKNNLETIIIHTLARLPVEVYDALNVSQILFVGPGPGQFGQALRLSLVGWADEPKSDEPIDKSVFASTIPKIRIERNLIVLSNELWDQPIEDAMWTVAHELAHLYLGHVERGGTPRVWPAVGLCSCGNECAEASTPAIVMNAKT
jgi:hypothetical protein